MGANRDGPVRPLKTDTYEETVGEAEQIGCIDIQTVRGPVHCHDAPGIMTFRADIPGEQSGVWLLAYDPEARQHSGKGFGLIHQMKPDEARTVAASLLRLANQIDGGERHN